MRITLLYNLQSIKQQMAHRVQYKKDIRLSQDDQIQLAYYKAEIEKVKMQYAQMDSGYKAKILSLSRRLKFGKKRIFFNQTVNSQTPKQQLERCNEQIKQIKQKIANAQNYQQQLQNNRVYSDPMSKIIQLTHQIMKLKKSLNQIKSKYDGNNYTEHRMKTSYESLRNQNQQLRQKIRQIEKQKSQIRKREEIVNYDELQTVKQKNKYLILKRQNDNLQEYILGKQSSFHKEVNFQANQNKLRLQKKKEALQNLKGRNIVLRQKKKKLTEVLQNLNNNKLNQNKTPQKYQQDMSSEKQWLENSIGKKQLDNTFA